MLRANPESTYQEILFGGFSRVDCTVPFLARAQSMARDASVVLEVGCGRGLAAEDSCALRRELRDFRRPGRKVIGIDVDEAARSNPFIDEFRLIGKDFRWPVEPNSVSLAFSDYVLEHVLDPEAYFAELSRVLKPGGGFIARTPSKWSYVSIAAAMIPNRLHSMVLSRVQEARKEEDVFPTVYRANTVGTLKRLLARCGLRSVVFPVEGEPNYMRFSQAAYSLMSRVGPLLPGSMKSTLIVVAIKET